MNLAITPGWHSLLGELGVAGLVLGGIVGVMILIASADNFGFGSGPETRVPKPQPRPQFDNPQWYERYRSWNTQRKLERLIRRTQRQIRRRERIKDRFL